MGHHSIEVKSLFVGANSNTHLHNNGAWTILRKKGTTVEPRYFEVTREMEKKFEIAGFQNNQGSVKFIKMNHFLIKYSTVWRKALIK